MVILDAVKNEHRVKKCTWFDFCIDLNILTLLSRAFKIDSGVLSRMNIGVLSRMNIAPLSKLTAHFIF